MSFCYGDVAYQIVGKTFAVGIIFSPSLMSHLLVAREVAPLLKKKLIGCSLGSVYDWCELKGYEFNRLEVK